MIYLDTSVVLAQLLAEDHRPPAALWSETLVASRLMEYEIWTRLHARTLDDSHGESARRLIGRIALLELSPPVLERCAGGLSRVCSRAHARCPTSGVLRIPAPPRPVDRTGQLRPQDDRTRPCHEHPPL